MFDSGDDGWNGNGALRINVNGAIINASVKVQTTASLNTPNNQRNTNTYTFSVGARDTVRLYWAAGSNQEENSFIVYYADKPPSPEFTASNNNNWSGANALVYRLRNTMTGISDGAVLGSFVFQ